MKKWCLLLLGLSLLVNMTMCFRLPGVQEDDLSHKRTKRETDCNRTEEYLSQGLCCLNCPAGTFVSQPCTEDHKLGLCQPCSLGKQFTSDPNGLESCESCRFCRTDQVMVKECTLTSNRICQCEPGRYCIPGEACEECLYCSRCGAGQRIKEECNATRNTVCENIPVTQPTSNLTSFYLQPTDVKTSISPTPEIDVKEDVNSTTKKDISNNTEPKNENESYFMHFISTVIVIAILSLLLLLSLFLYVWWWQRRSGETIKSDQANSQACLTNDNTSSAVSSNYSTPLNARACQERADQPPEEVQLLRTCNDADRPTREFEPSEYAIAQEPQNSDDPEPCKDDRGGGGGGGGGGTTWDDKPCNVCKESPPCKCYWTDCFHCIIDHVSSESIFRLMRQLRVSESTIDHIKHDNPNRTYEQCYELLKQWRTQRGKEASMETLFSTLRDMELGGCVENIINSLKI